MLSYMRENLGKDMTLDELAQQVHLNKNYLVRLFKQTYGQTPIQMLIEMRLEYGCDLITNTGMPISEIAAACGYSSAAYFIAEYKKHFGAGCSKALSCQKVCPIGIETLTSILKMNSK